MINQLRINNLLIYAFSDTHGCHRELQVSENVDIVICAGDAVEDNLVGNEYDDFIECSLPYLASGKSLFQVIMSYPLS